MVEMLLGGKALQHWREFKSQVMGLPILGVLDGEEENTEDKDKKQEATGAKEPMGVTLDTYKLCMRKFMCYYFVNHQNAARTQKHYL
eukprot:10301671-Ditylum_brightwellii.AAC.1